jgi:glycosyltransferase involved in cell wall biosynthesis
MRIAIIVPSLRKLAPVQVAISIGIQLAQRGHEVYVYHFGVAEEWPGAEEINFEKISFWSSFPWHQYHIIHSHGFLPDAFVSFRKPARANAKTISTIHNYVFPELRMLYGWLSSAVVGTAWLLAWFGLDHIVVLTDDALKYYRSYFKNKKLTRIYNGINVVPDEAAILPGHKELIEEMRSQFNYSIGVCSALIKRKRIDILIRHLSRVQTGCLFILGEGAERENLESLVTHLSLNHRVQFFGHVPQAYQYHPWFDVFAHPSASEGFSLSLVEAALFKKKIVCSDIPSFKEAFDEKEVTFFDSNNEVTLDKAIEQALKDDYKAENAFQKARREYTEEKMADQYEELFLRSSLNL